MKTVALIQTLAALLALGGSAVAAEATPIGLWKTIDDDTSKPKSLVRIVEAGGVFEGRIEKILDPDEPATVRCEKCRDTRHNQPIVGLLIIRDARQAEGKIGQWDGGDILDPENGKVYRLRLNPSPDGRQLAVRAYLGAPLLGRTQHWLRVD